MIYEKINTFMMAMLPIGELRFSIPWAIYRLNLEWYNALIYSVLGNSFVTLVLIFIIYYYKIDRIKSFIGDIPIIGFIFQKWENSSIKKSKKIEKWGYNGLIFFVGLPLPITGAWTAILIAFFLDLRPIKSFVSITFGLIISGTIVTMISIYFPELLEEFGWL